MVWLIPSHQLQRSIHTPAPVLPGFAVLRIKGTPPASASNFRGKREDANRQVQ